MVPTDLTLQVPWGHVSALSWGLSSRPGVLLVHGTQDNAGSFTRLIQLLPPTFHYVAIDLPGHGFSSHFPQGMNLDFFNFVLTIQYVLNELKWKNCFYIGHSFGGTLGVMFSILFPGRLQKIVTVDSLIPVAYEYEQVPDRLKTVFDATLFDLQRKEPTLYTREQVLDAIMNKRQFSLSREAAEALIVRAVTQVGDKYRYNRDVRMRAHVGLYFVEGQNFEFLKRLRTPVMVIVAKNSWFGLVNKLPVVMMYAKKFSDVLTLVHVDGNHDVHNNNPERVAPHVLSFFGNGTTSKL
ncbi:serine hydrolase-like protein [Fopius arisanus]|uniref:Serine hydrolase-like protein n=1 Tax=Fopius arisanus TaxID=64838 RepID=A0A9R1TL43_9HYME|nr:PREDICTED: serine hydrolase-like protein [Fopius arisanus]XP_011311271.1 PREDICTED: serine hydrolase-like protein [Fopius arisanus]XP_011311272.1 PREDICTED: serine hydrolase-like protein [Fopius arisanus]XP_011311273.1 PREDICTED: serine hydrolase-like protein [Fopius arisanus]